LIVFVNKRKIDRKKFGLGKKMKKELNGRNQKGQKGSKSAFYFFPLIFQSIILPAFFVFLFPLKAFTVLKHVDTTFESVVRQEISLHSNALHRTVLLDIVLPPDYGHSNRSYKVLYMNDGQDLKRLHMTEVLEKVYWNDKVEPFLLVAIHCGDRIQEYGTAAQADYAHRGAKASAYTAFVLNELMPYIQANFRVLTGAENTAFCGFSLGGLSAFDIVWHHPDLFGKVGAFSGSFWWRRRAYENHYDDENDRIMHRLVRQSTDKASLPHGWPRHYSLLTTHYSPKFWLQTGTEDEKDDRNNNGVIDSIEDTLDLIAELEKKGFRWGRDIRYVEVKGGHHNPATWSAIMPDFLIWAFGK
jgi:enterochelin esterase-like enzyme